MFSHCPSRKMTLSVVLCIAACFGASSGCGTVGPSHRSQPAAAAPFTGAECEPGLVLECEPLCMRGDMQACETAGIGFLEGRVVSQDLERAKIMLDRACAADQVLACSSWAKMSQDNQGVFLKPTREAVLLRLGCDRGDYNACYRVAKGLSLEPQDPEASPVDTLEQADAYFEKACNGGELHGCLHLALAAKEGTPVRPKDVPQSVQWFNQACAGDIAAACYEVALLQAQAGSPSADQAKARGNFDKACSLKAAAACARLAEILEEGVGTEKNIARAQELHELACDGRQPTSCRALGRYALTRDPRLANRRFSQACEGGLKDACFEQAKLLEGRTAGLDPEPATALERYQTACEGGIVEACGYAALLTVSLNDNGAKLTRDERAAVAAQLELGCREARDEQACLTLGAWLSSGEPGVKQDPPRAAALLGPLCSQVNEQAGYAVACQRLGRLSETGRGVPRNVFGAAAFYEKACAAGYAPSCLSHAQLLWRGTNGYKKDPQAAVAVFKRQCAQSTNEGSRGKPEACVSLAYAQLTGVGTTRNLAQAKIHFDRACKSGHQIGCAHLGHYYSSVRGTEGDRDEGKRLLRSACDSANGEGCFFLSELPSTTKSERQDLLKRACTLEVTDACLTLEAIKK